MPATLATLAAPSVGGLYYEDLDTVVHWPWRGHLPLKLAEHRNVGRDIAFPSKDDAETGRTQWRVKGSKYYVRDTPAGRAFFARWFANRCTFKDQSRGRAVVERRWRPSPHCRGGLETSLRGRDPGKAAGARSARTFGREKERPPELGTGRTGSRSLARGRGVAARAAPGDVAPPQVQPLAYDPRARGRGEMPDLRRLYLSRLYVHRRARQQLGRKRSR